MIDFFDSLYWKIPRQQGIINKLKIYSLARFFVRNLANLLLPIHFKLTASNPSYKLTSNRELLIVSLTSFPTRIERLWLVIESLLRQSLKPDMIILWLSKQQFSSLDKLPSNLLALQKRGLRIELRDNDLRSHKKWYYISKEYPNSVIITADDDIFYRSDMISTLVSYHKKFPHYVIANYAFKMLYKKPSLLPYHMWINNSDIHDLTMGYDIFFGSGGGTLFPPNSLKGFNDSFEIFMEICPYADDVWLNALCRVNHFPVLRTTYNSLCLPVLNKKDIRLTTYNVGNNMNDIQIAAVRKYYIEKYLLDPFIYDYK